VQHAPCLVLVVREREHEFLPTNPGPTGKKAKAG